MNNETAESTTIQPEEPLNAPNLNAPNLDDLNLDDDFDLGEVIAQAKIQATASGFTAAYQIGIEKFWTSKGISADLTNEANWAAAIAQIILEERKKVLLLVLQRMVCFAAPAFLIGILIGMKPEKAVLVVFPASFIAVLSAKD